MRTIQNILRLGAVGALASLTLTACGSQTEGTQPTRPAAVSAGDSAPGGPAKPTATPSDPGTKKASKVTKVQRDGKKPKPSISADSAPFDREVKFSDGLRLKILKVKQGKAGGVGLPGEFPDRPATTFEVRLTNGTKTSVELEGVVVTVTYGESQTPARLVYDKNARDFSGSVRPGASTTASYSASVPKEQLGDVTMHLDLDGMHTLATFTGSAK